MITLHLTNDEAESLLILLRQKRLKLQTELEAEYDNLDFERQQTIDLINRINIAMDDN